MNSYALETQVADPIQKIGMSFYFEPSTAAVGAEHGLNIVEFYGLGRGGVLGDATDDEIAEAFWFFHENAVKGMVGSAREKVEPLTAARSHLEAAYRFAEERLSSVPEATLRGFADASRKVINAVPDGKYALFDGYRKFPVPAEAARAAYLGTILLRELRGGVHIDATKANGVEAHEACYSNSEFIFKLHGYGDDDTPASTEGLPERMAAAEELTTTTMASYLDVLSDDERASLAEGVVAMQTALAPAEEG